MMKKKSVHNLFNQAKTHTQRQNITTTNRTAHANNTTQDAAPCYLDNLPQELYMAICQYLDVADLAKLARTNKNQQNNVYATPVASYGIWDTNIHQQQHVRTPTFKEVTVDQQARYQRREAVRQAYEKKLYMTAKMRDVYGRMSNTVDHPNIKSAAYAIVCLSQIALLAISIDRVMPKIEDSNTFTAFCTYSLHLFATLISPLNSMLICDGTSFALGKLYERSERSYVDLRSTANMMDDYLAEQPSRVFRR